MFTYLFSTHATVSYFAIYMIIIAVQNLHCEKVHLLLYSNSLEFEMFVGVRSYTNVCHTFFFFMNWYNHIAYRRKWTNINKRTAKQECWKFYKNNMSANAVTWDKLVVLHGPLTLLL